MSRSRTVRRDRADPHWCAGRRDAGGVCGRAVAQGRRRDSFGRGHERAPRGHECCRDQRSAAWRAAARSRPERVGAIAEQGDREQADDPQGGEFPAAVRVGEEEAGRAMHGKDRAKQDRHERQSHDAAVDAGDQGKATNDLGEDHEIGEGAGQAEAAEELGGAGGREDEQLQAGMGQEQNAERHAKHGGGIGGGAGVDHGRSPGGRAPLDMPFASWN